MNSDDKQSIHEEKDNLDFDSEFETFLEEGKVEINNLLWKYLPGDTTLREAEEIAIGIYHTISRKWNK